MSNTKSNELHRIKLTISGMPAYYAPEGQWDGAWFTRNPSEAKTYKLARNARKIIADFPTDTVWSTATVEHAS